MININELSTEEIYKLKDQCVYVLNTRREESIHKALNKLFSAMGELNTLDPCASMYLDGEYDWDSLMYEFKRTYSFK